MRKSIILLVVLNSMALMVASASAFVVVYDTDFEDLSVGSIDGQDDWVVTVTNGEITNDSTYVMSGAKSLIVYYGAGNADITKPFMGDALVNVEFDTGAWSTVKSGLFKIKDGSDHTAAQVGFSTNGQISAWNGTTKVDLMAYSGWETGASYTFRIVADATSQTYDFYVDDVLMADDYGFYNGTGSQLSELNIRRYTSLKLVVDNLVISAELECGAWGYPSSDLNRDCYVDIRDLAILAGGWLDCTHPDDPNCFE